MNRYFLDANVLYSVVLTDLFFHLDEVALCSVRYSSYVEEEALQALLGNTKDDWRRAGMRRRFDAMRAYASNRADQAIMWLDSRNTPPLGVQLPDPDESPSSRTRFWRKPPTS